MNKLLSNLYDYYIRPRSTDTDRRRQELILNIILTGLITASYLSLLLGLSHLNKENFSNNIISISPTIILCSILTTLSIISRRGYYKLSAAIIVGAFFLIASSLQVAWSFVLPAVALTFMIAIVLSGILFQAKTALIVSLLAGVVTVGIGALQVNGTITLQEDWINRPLENVDALGNAIAFCVVGLVTWISNREIDKASKRARLSEDSLKRERDGLELTVAKRTEELKSAQVVRIMELQRLSEYGRMGMSLLHDVANPLTVASINLERLQDQAQPEIVQQISNSVNHIERYFLAARKQLQYESPVLPFSVGEELAQIASILDHKARKTNVDIKFLKKSGINLIGDSVKFNQLIGNLIANAIESYSNSDTGNKKVTISYSKIDNGIELQIIDFGQGIDKKIKDRIFDPFFSTKTTSYKNMGIGLSMVKQYVENDFSGKIKVYSNKQQGTRFVIHLYNQKEIDASNNNSGGRKVSKK